VYALQGCGPGLEDIAGNLPAVHGMSPTGPGAANTQPHGKIVLRCLDTGRRHLPAWVAEPCLAAAAASNLQIGTIGSMNGRREETLLHGRICTHHGR